MLAFLSGLSTTARSTIGLAVAVVFSVVLGFMYPAIWWILLLGVLFVALLIFGYVGLLKLKERKKSKPFETGVLASSASTPQGVSASEQRAKLDNMRASFESGVAKFRAAGKDLYAMPWFVIVGAPASGKTEALRNCQIPMPPGLQDPLQGAGGTINMDWWFTNQAVILDTAGRLLFEEVPPGTTGEWESFLKMLRKARPKMPLNGVLLTLPADSLVSATPEKIQQEATQIAQQMDRIQRTLDIRFPVYVVVTKCDLVAGFREFFDTLTDHDLQHQMLGWSNPAPLDQAFDASQVKDILDNVREKLDVVRSSQLSDPVNTVDPMGRRLDQVDALYHFPEALTRLEPRLRGYLGTIFAGGDWAPKPVFLRGVYFTSSLSEGAALDGELAELFNVPAESLKETGGWERNRSYFLRDLFTEKVFGESRLVTRATDTRKMLARRRSILLGSSLFAVFLLLGLTFLGFRSFQKRIGDQDQAWDKIARNAAPPASLIGMRGDPIPGVQPDFEYYGKSDALGLGRGVNRAELGLHLADLVDTRIATPAVFRPFTGLESDLLKGDRVEAFTRISEQAVLEPALAAALPRLLQAAIDQDRRAEAAAVASMTPGMAPAPAPGSAGIAPAQSAISSADQKLLAQAAVQFLRLDTVAHGRATADGAGLKGFRVEPLLRCVLSADKAKLLDEAVAAGQPTQAQMIDAGLARLFEQLSDEQQQALARKLLDSLRPATATTLISSSTDGDEAVTGLSVSDAQGLVRLAAGSASWRSADSTSELVDAVILLNDELNAFHQQDIALSAMYRPASGLWDAPDTTILNRWTTSGSSPTSVSTSTPVATSGGGVVGLVETAGAIGDARTRLARMQIDPTRNDRTWVDRTIAERRAVVNKLVFEPLNAALPKASVLGGAIQAGVDNAEGEKAEGVAGAAAGLLGGSGTPAAQEAQRQTQAFEQSQTGLDTALTGVFRELNAQYLVPTQAMIDFNVRQPPYAVVADQYTQALAVVDAPLGSPDDGFTQKLMSLENTVAQASQAITRNQALAANEGQRLAKASVASVAFLDLVSRYRQRLMALDESPNASSVAQDPAAFVRRVCGDENFAVFGRPPAIPLSQGVSTPRYNAGYHPEGVKHLLRYTRAMSQTLEDVQGASSMPAAAAVAPGGRALTPETLGQLQDAVAQLSQATRSYLAEYVDYWTERVPRRAEAQLPEAWAAVYGEIAGLDFVYETQALIDRLATQVKAATDVLLISSATGDQQPQWVPGAQVIENLVERIDRAQARLRIDQGPRDKFLEDAARAMANWKRLTPRGQDQSPDVLAGVQTLQRMRPEDLYSSYFRGVYHPKNPEVGYWSSLSLALLNGLVDQPSASVASELSTLNSRYGRFPLYRDAPADRSLSEEDFIAAQTAWLGLADRFANSGLIGGGARLEGGYEDIDLVLARISATALNNDPNIDRDTFESVVSIFKRLDPNAPTKAQLVLLPYAEHNALGGDLGRIRLIRAAATGPNAGTSPSPIKRTDVAGTLTETVLPMRAGYEVTLYENEDRPISNVQLGAPWSLLQDALTGDASYNPQTGVWRFKRSVQDSAGEMLDFWFGVKFTPAISDRDITKWPTRKQ